MRLINTSIDDAYVLDLEPRRDERGTFTRLFCQRAFTERGLCGEFVQCNESSSPHAGTLRGLHYQVAPHDEVKVVRCVRGAVYDVIVDARPKSATYLKWFGIVLTPDGGSLLYVPHGVAHGYLTMAPNSAVMYQSSAFYQPSAERGIRWNDPAVGINWPSIFGRPAETISLKDRAWPDCAA
jgi:dTDP-4-dehydrorhamnose 3,5-epimerase